MASHGVTAGSSPSTLEFSQCFCEYFGKSLMLMFTLPASVELPAYEWPDVFTEIGNGRAAERNEDGLERTSFDDARLVLG